MSTSNKRWRGVAKLVTDAVEHGSRAVERLQKETARRPFGILEMIPAVALPARVAHVLHDVTVSGVHVAIRLVTRVVDGGASVAFDLAERESKEEHASNPGGGEPTLSRRGPST
jgi:hypothetical protein